MLGLPLGGPPVVVTVEGLGCGGVNGLVAGWDGGTMELVVGSCSGATTGLAVG